MNGTNSAHAVPQYLTLLDLTGRGFVVLGAGQGIGEQAAHALAQAGATVMCVDNDADRAKRIAQDVGGHACCADVLARNDMERVFHAAKEALGAVTGIVDIVGIARIKPLSAFDDAAWSRPGGLRNRQGRPASPRTHDGLRAGA